MINYTFIIPHKNTPDLLWKCISSIPRREDVQIIVVDDNSDSDKVDFRCFPGIEDESVEVLLTKEGKGAGYARNIGLKHAVGKWIVFADADDFFHPCIEDAMEEFKDSCYDVVFFKGDSVSLPDNMPAKRGAAMNQAVEFGLANNDYTDAVLLSVPWRKFFSHKLLEDNHIFFNEVPCANDVVFMGKVAAVANMLIGSEMCIYCATSHPDSIINNRSVENCIIRFTQECENISILRRTKYRDNKSIYYWHFRTWFAIYKHSITKAIMLMPKAVISSRGRFVLELIKAKML